MEHTGIALILVTRGGQIKYSNRVMRELLEYESADIKNQNLLEFAHPEDRGAGSDDLDRLFSGLADDYTCEQRLLTNSGREIYGRLQASLIPDEGERQVALITITDISAERNLKISLQETRRKLVTQDSFLNKVLASTTSLILTLDQDGLVTYANESAMDCLEKLPEQLIGKSVFDLIAPDSTPRLQAAFFGALKYEEAHSDLLMRVFAGGCSKTIGVNLTPVRGGGREERVVLIGGDITERLEMQAKLIQTAKMATLGEMATGVAHEINQPLNVIRLAAEMLIELGIGQSGEAFPKLVQERSEKIVAMVDRASRIINHLKTFGHQQSPEFAPLSLSEPIDQALELAHDRLRSDGIVVNRFLDESLDKILGDASSLEQVFLNLILNSADAMQGQAEKLITVIAFLNADKDRICVLFSDNGPGIPEEVRERIFDPFFSTKDIGKGTGLGMSISYGIIQSHNGSICILPSENGALFRIEFPVEASE